jgi:hypothetical protein
VFFIGFQDSLDKDFEVLKRKLGLPEGARLPDDAVAAHRSPQRPAPLEGAARDNIERWYTSDFAFVRLCRKLAPTLADAPDDPKAA